MRFLHTADLHLGMTPDLDKPWAADRAASVRLVLSRLIEVCVKEDIELLLIAGDLFHHPPMLQELREVDYLFSTLKRTKVCLIAGNHDYIRPGCAYESYPFGSNVTLLSKNTLSSVYYPQWNLEVYGLSYDRCEIEEPLYDALTPPKDGRRHILLAHGGDEKHIPVHFAELGSRGWDYVAMGHIHKPRVLTDGRIAYPGSPEPLDRSETGKHGYLLGTLKPGVFTLDWQDFSTYEYTELNLKISPETTQSSLEAVLKKRIAMNPRELFTVNLSGHRAPELVIDRDALLALGQIHTLNDGTVPDYPWEEWAARPAHDPIGRYVRALKKEGMSETEEKALYYGLDALLGGRAPAAEVIR